MIKLYNFLWEATMLLALALAFYYIWSNKQDIINSIYHALKVGGLI